MRRSPLSGWKWLACLLIAGVAMYTLRNAFSAPAKHDPTRIGILVVGSKEDPATVVQGGALMAQLHTMRERNGYSNQQLGLFIWDYSSSEEVAATAARFGITQKDLVFTGVVRVGPDNRPVAVLSRHTRVKDVGAVAQAVFAEAESAMGVAHKTPAAQAATPTPSTDFRVNADGSGDFPSLQQAVQTVPDGATLHLGAGTFKLEHGLDIAKSIRLQGEGMNVTTIVCDSSVNFNCIQERNINATFAANGISFECRGRMPCSVAVITGTIDVRACRFMGGRKGPGNNGYGLAIGGNAQGVVSDCECTQNQTDGIALRDHAAVSVTSNHCPNNSLFGISIYSDGKCNIRDNNCSGNGTAGVGIAFRGAPTLEGNRCTENLLGIYVQGASPTLLNNICSSNTDNGIHVCGDSAPTIERNVCNTNKKAGIAIYAPARGNIRNNTCTDNQIGILMQRDAQAILQDNTVTGNAQGNILRQ